MSQLTPRERDILRLLTQGQTPKQIAVALCVQRTTVYEALGNIRTKTATKSTLELAVVAKDFSSRLENP